MTTPPPPISDQEGCCGFCGTWHSIRNDNLMPVHNYNGSRCLGSGSQPVMVEAMSTSTPFQSVDSEAEIK